MSIAPLSLQELGVLLEGLCEERLSPAEFARLEQLLTDDPAARAYYVEYLQLHASLHWDTALSQQAEVDPVAELVDTAIVQLAHPEVDPLPKRTTIVRPQPAARSPAWLRRGVLVSAAGLLLCLGIWIGNQTAPGVKLAQRPGPTRLNQKDVGRQANDGAVGNELPSVSPPEHIFSSNDVQLSSTATSETSPGSSDNLPSTEQIEQPPTDLAAADSQTVSPPTETAGDGSTAPVQLVSFINSRLQAGWQQNGVTPSPRADDTEWQRRLYLDLVGHIPSLDDVQRFQSDRSPRKRAAEIDRLVDSPEFSRHFATIWTNLLVGRASPPEVDRASLARYLRQSFQQNRAWTEIVYDLITAEGRTDQNGAVNFLVAHLNNGAIPATGMVSRLFLGTQLQCVQCHNHPFNTTRQEQFWAFNSFFQQAVVVRQEKYDPKSGRMIVAGIELATKASEGPVYFETRNGLMKVAYPQYGSTRIDPESGTSRRRELARLMQSEGPGLAPAFVNRMWEHFHGRSFTQSVDDMGPHSPPSHPELLDRLCEEFVRSGYNVKQLARWICNSESYQLTSRFNETNTRDNPEAGELPLFSHIYVKPMVAEQLYDSLVVATQGQFAGGPTLEQSDRARDEWLRQFVVSYQTEENDEISTLDGSITQSLLMMNGELMREATSVAPGTWLHKLLMSKSNETDRIQALFQSALSRPASARELAAVRKLVKNGIRLNTPEAVYQDVYWALLNSNEFILNH